MQAELEVMEYTGERMVPEKADRETFWEHLYRYRFALQFVRGKRVLDIACGEGYGAHALERAGAARVVGIDVSPSACEHARRKYGVDARCGDAECIPLPDVNFEVVVSFETIEHLKNPTLFLDECRRVLVPGGTLLVSTPNRQVYGERIHNPFHFSEMTEDELWALLRPRFSSVTLYCQKPAKVRWWALRSLSTGFSAWNRLPGVQPLKEILCPHVYQQIGAAYRERAIDAILMNEGKLSTMVNPYVVRRRIGWGREEPYYFLAVARKPKT